MKRAIVILGLILAFSITTSKLQQRLSNPDSEKPQTHISLTNQMPLLALNSARASSWSIPLARAKVERHRPTQEMRMMATALELYYHDREDDQIRKDILRDLLVPPAPGFPPPNWTPGSDRILIASASNQNPR